MLPAFLVPSNPFNAENLDSASIKLIEKHLKALRIKKSEEVLFLNGQGKLAQAICMQSSPYFFKINHVTEARQLEPSMTLVLSPPKNPALVETITQATEMGIHHIQFWYSEFSTQKKSDFEKILSRSQRVASSACEQCVQPFLPKFAESPLKSLNDLRHFDAVVVCDEKLANEGTRGFQTPLSLKSHSKVALVIGPEGGWSAKERQIFDSLQVHKLSLGPLILRVPTACVSAMTYIFAHANISE